MDTKYQRKSNRQMVTQSFSPKLEERKSGNEKVANVVKNTNITSLPPAPTKGRKYPSLGCVNSSPSKISAKNDLVSSEKISKKFEPLKPTSPAEARNAETYLQKRPIKLAPLNLPEEVKEAQLQKMKEGVYLAKKSYNKTDKTMKALNDRPMKRDPFNKVGMAEEKPSEVKAETILPKDSKGLEDYKANIVPLSGTTRERMPSPSTIKIKSGQVNNSVPNLVTVDSDDISVKGRFSHHAKIPNTNHSILKPVKVNRLGMD